MTLVPTELFSFERKRHSFDMRYKIDYMCDILCDFVEQLTSEDVHLLRLDVNNGYIKISYKMPGINGHYCSFISTSNALMHVRIIIKKSRRIDIREKYTERLVKNELEL